MGLNYKFIRESFRYKRPKWIPDADNKYFLKITHTSNNILHSKEENRKWNYYVYSVLSRMNFNIHTIALINANRRRRKQSKSGESFYHSRTHAHAHSHAQFLISVSVFVWIWGHVNLKMCVHDWIDMCEIPQNVSVMIGITHTYTSYTIHTWRGEVRRGWETFEWITFTFVLHYHLMRIENFFLFSVLSCTVFMGRLTDRLRWDEEMLPRNHKRAADDN